MIISLSGVGSDTLLSDFDAAGIQYEIRHPEIGQAMMSGEWVVVSASAAAIASVLVAWIRARASRKVIITLSDNKIFQTEGLSVNEVERLLQSAKTIAALETKKPDSRKRQT